MTRLLIKTCDRKDAIAYLCRMNILFEEKEDFNSTHSLFII